MLFLRLWLLISGSMIVFFLFLDDRPVLFLPQFVGVVLIDVLVAGSVEDDGNVL